MSEAPKVVVVSPYVAEYGPPRTLEHVARALVGSGYEPVLVVPPLARVTQKLTELHPKLVTVEGLSTVPRTADPGRMSRFLNRHLEVASTLHRLVLDTSAVAVWSIGEATFAGGVAARRAGIPSLVHVIGMSIKSPRVGASVYIRFLEQLTETFVACSSAVAEMLVGFGVDDESIVVVHNGVPTEDVAKAAGRPVSLEGAAVGMVAAFDPRKGHELFVDAAAEIAAKRPGTRFYIIGGILEGQTESIEFEHRVRARIAGHGLEDVMTITGYLPTDEAYRWLAAMDVIVVPSRTEAFAHALVEAMACAKPVVASALEGNLDAFVDGHSGIFVNRSAHAVADAVSRLLDDPAEAKRMGEAARAHAKLLFDESVTLPALGAAVADAIAGPVRGSSHR